MELTILGCWAPYPRAGGACSSYLTKTEQGYFLMDCGNGALSKLQEYIDFRQLAGVIITHLHPDHHLDLFSLRHAIDGALKDGSRDEKLKVYLPSEPKETFLKLYNYKQTFEIIAIETIPVIEEIGKNDKVRQLKLGDLKISFLQTKHPVRNYAVSFEEEKRLVYSGDTAYKEELVPFVDGAQTLLCEASLQESHKELTKVGHLTAKEAGDLAKKAEVESLVLTHFWPEYNLDITINEAEETFGKKVYLAREGDRHTV